MQGIFRRDIILKKNFKSMKNFRSLVIGLCVVCLPVLTWAQRITYSEPERDDSRNTEFEIIGKVGGNILVYKNNRGSYAMSVYDNDMRLKDRVEMDFIPRKLISVDFVPYSDHFLMIYQFQRREYVYCFGLKLNGEGKFEKAPELIDSTRIGNFATNNLVYSVAFSEDKSRIMVYKINQDNEINNIFYTFLLDNELKLINNSRVVLTMENKRNFLNNFVLTNEGDLVFNKLKRTNNRDYLDEAALVIKPAGEDTLNIFEIPLQNQFLDDVKLKVDNINKRIYIASFYYKQKRGNVEGLYLGNYNIQDKKIENGRFLPFSNELKMNARGESSTAAAFNDYFLKSIIAKKDGGFLVLGESFYTSSRYQPWDRWSYLYGPYYGFTPYYYIPYSSFYYNPFYYNPYFWGNNQGTRYHYDNIMVLSYDQKGNLEWSNFVRKNQFDDNDAHFLSYQLVNIGSELHFLYNELDRRTFILTDIVITPEGKLSRMPTLRNLDRGYAWMPRYGKQISARQVVVPCIYRNFICFAKIDF